MINTFWDRSLLGAGFFTDFFTLLHQSGRIQPEFGRNTQENLIVCSSSYLINLNISVYHVFTLRNFLEYEWGMEAFMIPHDRIVKGRKDLLIVILKEKINVERLPPDLRAYISKYELTPDLRVYTIKHKVPPDLRVYNSKYKLPSDLTVYISKYKLPLTSECILISTNYILIFILDCFCF